ncbi:hypothetical protein DDE82_003108 [Stemphylium lycopersici]|nr:hypothetical protein TW65_98152 [Stemphylium lycopersici]RAR06876.1 hypothetical protein DDE82_003108 [Stemphylium lycopersici]
MSLTVYRKVLAVLPGPPSVGEVRVRAGRDQGPLSAAEQAESPSPHFYLVLHANFRLSLLLLTSSPIHPPFSLSSSCPACIAVYTSNPNHNIITNRNPINSIKMPIRWTAELDAVLLHGVFEECNISFSKALCSKIAQRVADAGMPCTAKAIENRLYSWKKKNISGNSNLNSATSTPAKSALATPVKTPRSRAKVTPRAKKGFLETPDGPEGLVDDDEVLLSPTAARGKRALNGKTQSYTEAEEEGEEEGDDEEFVPKAKKVKSEPFEDEVKFIEEAAEEEEV